MPSLYSIGYATKALEVFIDQLHTHGVTAVADVRSVPYSPAFHDFHREPLAAALKQHNIAYVYLGEELGPRSPHPAHYNADGQVQFSRLQAADHFLTGVQRLFAGMDKDFRIAMMCAEKDPATCHRSLLIAHFLLHQHAIDVAHIRHDGALETETALEERLMSLTDIQPDMLTRHCDCLPLAWQEQCRRYAYIKP
ncbi:DUF488 domain-containing protein [Spongiibacter sp. KMU-166]|uniref:DUF488 domain-containing protein n=1 Tax=Spongiibacter thalassae TaxID=2721624 RepID=A0ABX1GCE9_9GAMM|nr:DUF488 domain-containing protein [Spongiibacter thalassae]NKI16631.1 DUF488 domain-containing protein [Spongiibacter thalassae]